MLDVHVLTATTRSHYEDDLRRFALDRRPGWGRRLLSFAVSPRRDDCVELIAFGPAGSVAGCRLTPEPAASIASARRRGTGGDAAAANAQGTVAVSAIAVLPDETDPSGIEDAMWCAVMEWCVDARIGWVRTLQSDDDLKRRREHGWQFEILGSAMNGDGGHVLDVVFRVDRAALAAIRRAAMVHRRLIVAATATKSSQARH